MVPRAHRSYAVCPFCFCFCFFSPSYEHTVSRLLRWGVAWNMSLPLLYVAGEKLFPLNYDVFCFIRLTDCTLVSVSDSLRSLSLPLPPWLGYTWTLGRCPHMPCCWATSISVPLGCIKGVFHYSTQATLHSVFISLLIMGHLVPLAPIWTCL